MRTALSPLEVETARDLADALAKKAQDPERLPLAGCTDVYVTLEFGTLPASHRRFLNLWPLRRELGGIALTSGTLRLGAMATFTDCARSPLVMTHLPMLVDAAKQVGGLQIQNRGTLGGNVANGSPAGDSLPVLAAAEATVVLASVRGERRVPFAAFYTGYRKNVMAQDELITAFELPVEGLRDQWFRKVGTRAAQAISKVALAGCRGTDGAVRLAAGSVGPTVLRLPHTEWALAQGADAAQLRAMVAHDITPVDDLRSTRDYRLLVAQNLIASRYTPAR